MEQINDIVGYKNLKIYQNDDWFKFSLESVLLACFVTINQRFHNILDLCTGNAPIPLILSTRTRAKIIGVELQRDVFDLARKSVSLNKLDNQIEIINDNVSNLKNYYVGDCFDAITVNPPYFFDYELSSKNEDIHKAIARHEIKTNLDEIFKISTFLLKNDGYFAMVHRTERFFEIIDKLKKYNLTPKKIQFIYTKKGQESRLFMIECVKNGKNYAKFLEPLYIQDENGEYTKEVKRFINP